MRNRFVLFSFIAVVALFVTGLSLTRSAQTEQGIYHTVLKETYMLTMPERPESGGTGFGIQSPNGDSYVLSNAHVCAATEESFMTAKQGNTTRRLRILNISQESDLCLLEGMPGTKGLGLADAVSAYEKVYIVGHPYLNPVSIAGGYLNGRGTVDISYCRKARRNFSALPSILGQFVAGFGCIQFVDSYFSDAYSAPGNSGSAVVNEYAEVVGVLFAGNGMGVSLIVPLEYIYEFLSQN